MRQDVPVAFLDESKEGFLLVTPVNPSFRGANGTHFI